MQTGFRNQNRRPRVLVVLEWYSHEIHNGIADFAKKSRWILDVQMRRSGHPPTNWKGDGIICMLGPNGKLVDCVKSRNVPTVNVAWRDCPLDIPMVLHDDKTIGRMAAEHFISNGFINLAYYRSEKLAIASDRGEGFKNFAKKLKLNFINLDISSRPIYQVGKPSWRQEWLIKELKKLPKPLAVFAQNDDHALEVLYACETVRISVPQDVAIVGCDNDEILCSLSSVQLSSIQSNQFQLGYQAAKRLSNILRHNQKYSRPLLIKPSELFIRKSSDMTAVNDPNVATALAFIRENAHRLIDTGEVVSVCGISRRKLYMLFNKELGHGIAEEITRRKISIAKNLMNRTSFKLSQVAKASGFANLQHMRNTFIRIFGACPSKLILQ